MFDAQRAQTTTMANRPSLQFQFPIPPETLTPAMEVFTGREVEVGPDPRDPGPLAENVLAIARSQLETGTVFQEGHTIGESEKPEAFITLERSNYGEGNLPIFRLNMVEREAG